MSVQAVPSALSATLAIAAVTLRRLSRGRALWVCVVIACLPLAYAMAMRGRTRLYLGEELFLFVTLVLSVLAPMLIASSIGEEIEDRTLTYLWSRPVPRWSVLAGKLAALAPLTLAIVLVSWVGSITLATGHPPTLRSCIALGLGTLTMSTLATGMAALSPRHGMAFTIVYMLFFDLPVGLLPATLAKISISHEMRVLSGVYAKEAAIGSSMIALLAICLVWSTLAAWRIRRLEA